MKRNKKYKFTKPELQGLIFSALMWASDGLEVQVVGEDPKPFIMGDPENLTLILVEALTTGLPNSEDSSTSTAIS